MAGVPVCHPAPRCLDLGGQSGGRLWGIAKRMRSLPAPPPSTSPERPTLLHSCNALLVSPASSSCVA